MTEVKYIKELEKTDGSYSVITLEKWLDDITFLESNKNLEAVYTESLFTEDNKNSINKKIYKTSGDFYIYVEKGSFMYFLSIFYPN